MWNVAIGIIAGSLAVWVLQKALQIFSSLIET
jgi:hypothetical protein